VNEDQTSPQEALGNEASQSDVQTTKAADSSPASGEAIEFGAETGDSALAALQNDFNNLSQENLKLQQEIAELKDQGLRVRADFENTRKRLQRDKDEAVQFANKQLLTDVVAIIDDFERAIRSSEAAQEFQSLHDGISLIEKQFIGMLERKWGIKRFDAIGEEFDPQRHEAVAAEPRSDLAAQSILEVYQKGYLLHEKVLRSAKVKVSLPG